MEIDESVTALQLIVCHASSHHVVFRCDGATIADADVPAVPRKDGVYVLLPDPLRWAALGKGGHAAMQLVAVLATHAVNPLFPVAVRKQLATILEHREASIADDTLVDYTGHAYVTIDNDDSTDLDQAMFIEKHGTGYLVHYALSDASYYVKPGTPLFEESLKRGTSFYLPRFSVPMLPRALSSDLISLNPNVDRRALVFHIELDEAGLVVGTMLDRGRIHSRAKLSYRGVQEYHDSKLAGNVHELAGHDYTETLDLLKTVGTLRIAEAESRDIVKYDRVELHIDLKGEDVREFGVVQATRYDTERWNEQVSLLVNMEGAKWLAKDADAHVQAIYRVHEAPDEARYKNINHFVEDVIRLHELDAAEWRWRKGESVATFIERLPREAATERVRKAIERQFLIVNSRSTYSNEPGLHFALQTDPYARFSAPMREVVGIFTHKEAFEKLDPSSSGPNEADEALREAVIQISDAAKTKQNAINKSVQELALNALFSDDVCQPLASRPVRFGTIMGAAATRMYVAADDPPMELKIYAEDLNTFLGGTWALDKESFGMVFTRKSDSPPATVTSGKRKVEDKPNSPAKRQKTDPRPPRNSKWQYEFALPEAAVNLSASDVSDKVYKETQFVVGSQISFIVAGYDAQRCRWQLIPCQEL